jgi:hypothetical protein
MGSVRLWDGQLIERRWNSQLYVGVDKHSQLLLRLLQDRLFVPKSL